MQNQPNIIFVMLDTVRADVLSTYGGQLKLRNIDSIAKKSLVFNNAIAPATYTLPSHLSIFLGKRPRTIKELKKDNIKNYNDRTDPFLKKTSYVKGNEVTLAKHLSYLGYNTALFSNNPFISSAAGVANGFSYVENMFVDDKIQGGSPFVKTVLRMINNDFTRNNLIRVAYHLSKIFPDETLDSMYLKLRKKVDRHYSEECGYYNLDNGAEQTNLSLKRYLETVKWEREFIFINYMEGHEGYPTNLVTDKYVVQDKWLHMIGHNKIEDAMAEKAAYMKRIEYLDKKVGSMLNMLKRKGTLDNAFVIIAGDHGQAFMEHGQMYHNVFPYNEVIRVPLIISKFEDGKQVNIGKQVQKAFSLTSLNKIIPDMGYGIEKGFENSSSDVVVSDHLGITEVWDTYLLKLLSSRSKHADAVYKRKLHFNKFASAVIYNDYKLIHFYGRKKDEMYSMNDDPEEKFDVIDSNRNLAHTMINYNKIVS